LTPYTTNLDHHTELEQITFALKLAICLAKEHGTDAELEQIKAAYTMLENHETSGGYESQGERNAAYMAAGVAEMNKHGHD
jgi:hypothetical protein